MTLKEEIAEILRQAAEIKRIREELKAELDRMQVSLYSISVRNDLIDRTARKIRKEYGDEAV